jgi:2'-5' RNA ligase
LPDDLDDPAVIRAHDWQAFRALTRTTNHWNRPGWTDGRRSYHWLVDCSPFEPLRQLAAQCQAPFDDSVFDLAPHDSLHLTLGRVGFTDEITRDTALMVANEATPGCAALSPFRLEVGPLAGSPGALRFTVTPWTPLLAVYDQLAAATRAVLGARAVMDRRSFRPHLSIAYANTDGPVTALLPVAERLRELPAVAIIVESVMLVELRREGRTYRYDRIGELLLEGAGS